MKRITIFDYGAGNLHSLAKALEIADVMVAIETDPVTALQTDLLVLPGVGAFSHAAERLAPGRAQMREALLDGLPALGICLGMQLLFDASEEGPGEGLGVIPGHVRRLRASRVPHIGWNEVEISSTSSTDQRMTGLSSLLTQSNPEAISKATTDTNPDTGKPSINPIMYFANSYVCDPAEPSVITAYTTHETDRFVAAVATRNTIGVQFHPEKSSSTGLEFVRAFAREAIQK